jgi:exonuclease SbcD
VEAADPIGKLRSVYPNVMLLEYEARAALDLAALTAEPGRTDKLSPLELFGEFFLDVSGGALSPEQARIAREIFGQEGNV